MSTHSSGRWHPARRNALVMKTKQANPGILGLREGNQAGMAMLTCLSSPSKNSAPEPLRRSRFLSSGLQLPGIQLFTLLGTKKVKAEDRLMAGAKQPQPHSKASKVAPACYTQEVNSADSLCIPDSQLRAGHPWLAFLSRFVSGKLEWHVLVYRVL